MMGIIIPSLLCLSFCSPSATAAPKVVLYNINLTAEPFIAGKGMPITLTASVEFGGACCYTVYAHDVKAELNLTPGLRLVAGDVSQPVTCSGESEGRVAALPGGGLTKVPLTWTLKGESYGTYTATLRVTGYSIRSPEPDEFFDKSENVVITIAAGAVVSSPSYPHAPMVGKDTLILVNVTALVGEVTEVRLNYSFNNKTWASVQMTKTSVETDSWLGVIPKQSVETNLYFNMSSLDSRNERFNSTNYTIRIRDYGQINSVTTMGNVLLLVVSIVGIIAIFFVYRYNQRLIGVHVGKGKMSGLLPLGTRRLLTTTSSMTEVERAQLVRAKRRQMVLVVIVVLVVVLFVAAILSGDFRTIVSKTTNPQGA